MTKVFIIHGTGANSNSNWFPWLKRKLEKDKITVYVPKFPTGKNQSLSNWFIAFDKYLKFLDKDTIMVGHSIGPAFIMDLLQQKELEVKSCFFIIPFIGDLGLKDFDPVNRTFTNKKMNWTLLKSLCKNYHVYASDNDPYVPLQKSKFVAKKLKAKFRLVKGGKHLNAEAGYKKFELLLKDIQSESLIR